jgi:hypothetical protein
MALEMEDALSGNIAELGNLDFVEGVFAHTKARKRLLAGRIARMDDCTLVQVPAIDFNRIVHIDLEFTRAPSQPWLQRPASVAIRSSLVDFSEPTAVLLSWEPER